MLASCTAWRNIAFSKTKVDKHTIPTLVVEQEVCGLDIAMDNTAGVKVFQASKETGHILLDLGRIHEPVKVTEVVSLVIGQNNDNLVFVTESSNERRHVPAAAEVLENGELILDPRWRTGDQNLLECHFGSRSFVEEFGVGWWLIGGPVRVVMKIVELVVGEVD
jgi:hypothetical protein